MKMKNQKLYDKVCKALRFYENGNGNADRMKAAVEECAALAPSIRQMDLLCKLEQVYAFSEDRESKLYWILMGVISSWEQIFGKEQDEKAPESFDWSEVFGRNESKSKKVAVIDSFSGEYEFLSNAYPSVIEKGGILFRNAEAAFQAEKVTNRVDREVFVGLSAAEARKLGHKISLRKDWDKRKEMAMYEICYQKFDQNPDLKEKLLATGDAVLKQESMHRDTFWGTVNGKGENKLGIILMEIRKEFQTEKEEEAEVNADPFEKEALEEAISNRKVSPMVTLEEANTLYRMLQGDLVPGFTSEDQPCLTPEEAFTIIRYLQEVLHLIPDYYEQDWDKENLVENSDMW